MNDPITHPNCIPDFPCGKSDASPTQAQTAFWLPPIHLRVPDLRPAPHSKPYVEPAESPITDPAQPTFDGVDAALDQVTATAPRTARPRYIRTRHAAHTARFKSQATSAAGPSWRSVVLLIFLLLAAAGMTLWITNGSTRTPPEPTLESTHWDTLPPTMAGNRTSIPGHGNSPLKLECPPGDAAMPRAVPLNMPPLGQANCPRSMAGSNISNEPPIAAGHPGQGRIAHVPGPTGSYQAPDTPSPWQFTPVEFPPPESDLPPVAEDRPGPDTDSAQECDPSHATTAPVSFTGLIESPNLRARYDHQRSILH